MSEAATKIGWRSYRFDEMATMVNDRVDNPEDAGVDRYVGLEHLDRDSLKIRRWGSPSDVMATKLRFRAGDIIFGRRRVYQRKLAVADFDGICSAHAMVLRAKPEIVLAEFLPFFMQSDSFMERAREISVGSLSPTINWKALAKQEFVLPPASDQSALAQALTEMMAVRESVRGLKERLLEVETAYLEDMLQAVGAIESTPVVDLLREPPRNGMSPPANSDGSGLRTVSISSVADGIFDPTGNIKHADANRDRVRPYLVQRGDVFVVRGNGNRTLCGKAGICEKSYEDLFYPDLLIRLRFDPSRILPEFAVAQWNLPSVHRGLSARAKSSNGIWKVNGNDIRVHRLYAPPMAIQEDVMTKVRDIRRAVGDSRRREREALRLSRRLLQHLEVR